MRYYYLKSIVFTLFLLLSPNVYCQMGSFQLAFPVKGQLNVDFFIANYIDYDTTNGVRDPFGGEKTINGHTGLDIILPNFRVMDRGIDVLAAEDGIVTNIHDGEYDRRTCGYSAPTNYVVIKHKNGFKTIYLHLKKNSIIVKVGDKVKKGQKIALVGSSGASTDPHLHFEIRDSLNRIVDPFKAPYGNNVSLWEKQPPYDTTLRIIDFDVTNHIISRTAFKERPDPYRNFKIGQDSIVCFWVEALNFKPTDTLKVILLTPNGKYFDSRNISTQRFYSYGPYNVVFPMDSASTQGEWTILVKYKGTEAKRLTFRMSY